MVQRGDDEPEWCEVGCRIRHGERLGTVRWRGEVAGRGGGWCGVEWDEPGTGKHDGEVGGVRYFRCRSSAPDCASFVRARSVETSVSCAQAIRDYYSDKEDESTAALHKAVIDEWKKKIKVPFVEMVGFDSVHEKQGNLNNLQEACVSDKCIWTSGELSSLCPNLESLDVSKNLLTNWNTVSEITSQLPHLEYLNLSKNRLTTPSTEKEAIELSSRFEHILKINLAHCDLEWEDIHLISKMLRQMEETVLAYNRIEKISMFSSGTFSDSLAILVLDGNPLDGWNEILKLGNLKNLISLSVNDCNLKTIAFDDRFRDEKTDLFGKLEQIYLKHNMINDWRSISELNKLKSLSKLYITRNPLITIDNYDTVSQFIIARIEKLQELNGSEINKEIRRGAEYDYLKKHGLSWKQNNESREEKNIIEFALHHSRFNQLIQKYGLPDDNLLAVKKDKWAISTKLIEVTLKDEATGITATKKVPITMNVQKLIALTRRIFSSKTSAAKTSTCPALYCVQRNRQNQPDALIPLDNQMKELDFFSVSDGDTIIIRW